MKYLLLILLWPVLTLGYSSLDTSTVFHWDDCTSIQGKDPNRIEIGTYAEFTAKGETPCKVCKPTVEMVETQPVISNEIFYAVTVEVKGNHVQIKCVLDLLSELKNKIQGGFMTSKDFAQWARDRYRPSNYEFNYPLHVWVAIEPRPIGSVNHQIKPVTPTDAEALEMLRKLIRKE